PPPAAPAKAPPPSAAGPASGGAKMRIAPLPSGGPVSRPSTSQMKAVGRAGAPAPVVREAEKRAAPAAPQMPPMRGPVKSDPFFALQPRAAAAPGAPSARPPPNARPPQAAP